MQNRLLVLQPGLLAGSGAAVFNEAKRTLPIQLNAVVRKDSVRLDVPPGFKLDEMPEPVRQDSPYGTYSASWSLQGATLLFEQALEIKDVLAPPAELPAIRAFFETASAASGAAVIFVRK